MDLRGGAALVLAGLCTEGKTVVDQARIIDRGYETLESDLNMHWARISEGRNRLRRGKRIAALIIYAAGARSGALVFVDGTMLYVRFRKITVSMAATRWKPRRMW